MVFPGYKIGMTVTTHNRKLKEKMRSYKKPSSEEKRDNSNSLNMEDYPRIDPVPSSKANIHSGSIEHGTPLMPYIPKPTPPAPTHPKHGASP
ncbi:hypothetical protein BVC80_897g23 [Macleaya cordata]|uniref:Uncharacterized protein n=1 Tax=Macleaya cordata TaxID=56857 RepID=A0A200QFN3_MACCD|nr:hypothetical protein BVC80_897g23 [Macleaya cordata]